MSRTARRRAPAPPRRLAGIAAAAAYLDCNERTIRRMIRAGTLSGYRVGRHLKVDMHEVYEYATPVPPESVAC